MAPVLRIFRLRRVWERLAREDPFGAVLTDPARRGNRWPRDEFFRTGHGDVDACIAWLREYAPAAGRRDAFDFGCGVGRLSQALGRHYDHVIGVDVAARMIELACHYSPLGADIRYIHNPHSHLRQFADATQDLVFSLITLQHVPAELVPVYLGEFVRICRPGGHVIFQLPTYTPPPPRNINRLSFYPPTVAKRIRRRVTRWFRRTTGIGDEMHMTAVAESEVRRLLHEAGATVLATRDHPMGSCRSLFYLAQRI